MSFRKLHQHKDFPQLFENFISLSVLNGLNVVFPLILIPYLTRVLGFNGYGNYAFVYAIINYCTLFIRYGFELSATKQVAIIRHNKEKLNLLFSSILAVRLFLLLAGTMVLVGLIFVIPKFYELRLELLFSAGILMGNALIPIWFFQGMERMKFMTFINFVVKLIATVSIFLFVKNPDQVALALALQSSGYVLGGVLSILLAIRIFEIRLIQVDWENMKQQLVDGWHLFMSVVGVNFYRESNILILGFFISETHLGYYAVAEKMIKAIQNLITPFVNTIFPYFSRKLNSKEEVAEFLKVFKKTGWYYAGIVLAITAVSYFVSPFVLQWYLGGDTTLVTQIFRGLSLVILLGGLSYFYGIVGMVNLGYEKLFVRSVWVSGISSIVICLLATYKLGIYGGVIAMLSAEFLLLLQIMFYRKKLKFQ